MSPLRRRVIEDMTFGDVRRDQLHLSTNGAGVPTINQAVAK
jgi:hypothetical protein